MSKHSEVQNAKLSFDKEAVANLSDQEMDQLAGGNYETVNSTASNITCCWCTSTRPTPELEQAV